MAKDRPTIALVLWELGTRSRPSGLLADLVATESCNFEFVVISTRVAPELQSFVRWEPVWAPPRPFRLRWATFFAIAGIRLRRIKADLVHSLGPGPLIPNRVDLASVNFCHACYHEALPGRPPRSLSGFWRLSRAFTTGIERWYYGGGRARALAADTPGAAADLVRHFPQTRVFVTPIAVDTDLFRPDAQNRSLIRGAFGLGTEDVVVLFVGRDPWVKGLEIAIAGFADACGRSRQLAELWVLGIDQCDRFQRFAEQLSIGSRVRFLGSRPDVERYYQAADIFVLPTLTETFCRAAHEAAATELPVVATDVNGIRELVGRDEAGIIVRRNPASVAAALARLASDPETRAGMGKTGRHRCLTHTVTRSVQSFVDAYRTLLG